MERMKEYFDRIKADDQLKEKTKAYIKERIALENEKLVDFSSSTYSLKTKRIKLKRFAFTVIPITACLIMLIGGYAFYQTPVNYISLDINPSVELGLNRFDRVVEAEGANVDGNSLLDGINIRNMSAFDAMKTLVLEADKKGFVREDGSTIIAVTTFSDKKEEALRLKNQMAEMLRTMVEEGLVNAGIYTDSGDLQLRTEAWESGVSPGKYVMQQKENTTEPERKQVEETEQIIEQEQNKEQSPSSLMQEKGEKTYGNQIQNQVQSQETTTPSIEAGPVLTDDPTQNQMTSQPAIVQVQSSNSDGKSSNSDGQSSKPDSPGGQGGSQNNKQGPN